MAEPGTPKDTSAMIGQRIGNYQVTRLLAEGGMGAVYVAEHPAIGRKVAVKVLLPAVAADQEMVRRFFNEARAAHSIRHPGIVEILDFGTLDSGASYIVMEYLEGETLAARLRLTGRLRPEDAVALVLQAASALGAAHAAGIVHRDLKPDNLFLTPDARLPGNEIVKVLDFGIAKLGQGPGGAGSFKTRTGMLMGTPVYMSPEQCLGTKEVDHRTDIYALAVILYQMLCGSPPFMSEGHGELIHMQISAPAPRLRPLNANVSPQLEEVVLHALAKDPAQRHQSMAELRQALQAIPASVSTDAAAASSVTAAAGSPVDRGAGAGDGRATGIVPRGMPAVPTVIDGEIAKLRRRQWVPAAIGGVLVVAIAAGALVAGMGRSASPARPTERQVAELSARPVAPPVNVNPTANPTPTAEEARVSPKISVSLTSEPPGARVVREKDRAVIGVTPFQESWTPANGAERLRVEMAGYQPESVLVPLDRGIQLRFTLTRAAKPSRPAPARPARPSPRRVPVSEPVPL